MRVTGALILLVLIACGCVFFLLLIHRTRFGKLLHEKIPDRPERRLFLASISFFCTFAAVRALTYCIHNHIGPFHDVVMGGRHIHHLVWGILILLVVGYGWLADVGTGQGRSPIVLSHLMSLLFGAGAALTLDEFALWLNLQDVYWARQGRSSIDIAVLFGTLLAIGARGRPLWRSLLKRS